MNNAELLKKMIADISNDPKYFGKVYEFDDILFIIDEKIYAIDNYDISYYTPCFTEEESKEVKRIEKELDLQYEIFLPIKGGVAWGLQELIEYYGDEKSENKINHINKLINELSKEDSIFYKREEAFLNIFLNPDLESGVPYVHSQWDHDEAYYLGLPFSTGVEDPLYEVIRYDSEFYFPDDELEDDEDYDNECKQWIDILSDINKYSIC